MDNSFWFIILVIFFSSLFIYTILKEKSWKVLILYTFMTGLTYTVEVFIEIFFNAYNYYPHILKNSYFDNMLGAMASNMFSIPMSSVFIAILSPSLVTVVIFILLLLGIEILFLALGIYSHNWWNIMFTAIGVFGAFIISIFWYKKLNQHLNLFYRWATIFFSGFMIHTTILFIPVALLNAYLYQVNWFNDPFRDHTAFGSILIWVLTFLYTFVVIHMPKRYSILAVVIAVTVDFILYRSGILQIYDPFSFIYIIILRVIVILILIRMNHYLIQRTTEPFVYR
ncbi:hypothetical protein [Evansella tamaricis]|uniref:Uncharacterized protein n=1 Tax=Evansella tamaricis TaxID=2069301 RepID=A0ABS6JIX8_9BACI|nr:hypothetical protein [Evansella tamaricis]MBU9713624.1 hypothetical protein [Evansella tamaricis]